MTPREANDMYGGLPPPKSRIKSRTHWFNVIMAVFVGLEANIHLLQPLLPVNVYAVTTLIAILGNIALRELTRQPIG